MFVGFETATPPTPNRYRQFYRTHLRFKIIISKIEFRVLMKVNPKSQRLIYYSAGSISLIFLPIICFWYLHKNNAFDKFVSLEITWWAPRLSIDNPQIYPKESHPDKLYTEISLTGNTNEDSKKLEYAKVKIKELVISGDTLTGVHFHFSDNSKYWTLIKAIDMCYTENATYFIPYGNDLWVSNPKPAKPNNFTYENFCGGSWNDDVVAIKSKEEIANEREEKVSKIKEVAKTYFPSGILFIIMTALTIKRIYLAKTVLQAAIFLLNDHSLLLN